jgi:SAM-dependent MidA family methyltransferase
MFRLALPVFERPLMSSPLQSLLVTRVRTAGPMTVAEYVDLALYHPEHGYYASAAQRSGRSGDFFTAVDLGPVFGELLARQVVEMWRLVQGSCDLVEAAAGNGRLSRDLLDAAAGTDVAFLDAVRLHLVERSPRARAAQLQVLGPHASRLRSSGPSLPDRVRGVILANELLDALPPHLVVMRPDGLREVFVEERAGRLTTCEASPSSPRIEAYLSEVGARLEPGWFAEVNLAAADWVREAARSLECGFLVLVDYGHEASRLYSSAHSSGTLASFRAHASEARDQGPGWLLEPGERDITSHVDLTGVRMAAESGGLTLLGLVDQTYFLLALGLAERQAHPPEAAGGDLHRRLALKTLLMPGGMGSTHKVMVFGKNVGRPSLTGLGGGRLT